ncbi:MAG: hypothetical protein GOP50_04610 [Candidatus Heimdallarchaeota archaeon]|nr:hypothetical protein [Candidatus Heimdallarchaeota archaeon]
MLLIIFLTSLSALTDSVSGEIDEPPPTLYTPVDGHKFTDTRYLYFTWEDLGSFYDEYQIQIATDTEFFSYVTGGYEDYSYFQPVTFSFVDNLYYWRVRAHCIFPLGWTVWSSTWNFSVALQPPIPPVLTSPLENEIISDSSPELHWETSESYYVGQYASSYDVQISNSSQFSYLNVNSSTTSTNYSIVNPLEDNTYWWRVRPIGWLGSVGGWSTRNFTVDTMGPSAPIQQSPNIGQLLTGEPTALTWDYVAGAKEYNVQLSNNEYFLPTFFDEKVSSYYYITATSLSEGTYYWRVCAIDYADNVGDWSDIWNFKVDTNPPTISEVTFGPTLPTVDDEVVIYCDVTDFGNINYIKVTYQYDGEEEWFEDYATPFMGTIYTFSIGPFSELRQVNFYLTAVDELAHVSNSTMFHVQIVQPITSANYPLGVSSVLFSLFSSMIVLTVIRKKRRKKS